MAKSSAYGYLAVLVCSVICLTSSVIQVITLVYGSMRYLYTHKVMGYIQTVVGKEIAVRNVAMPVNLWWTTALSRTVRCQRVVRYSLVTRYNSERMNWLSKDERQGQGGSLSYCPNEQSTQCVFERT